MTTINSALYQARYSTPEARAKKRAYWQKWREENKEAHNARLRRWYAKNKDRVSAKRAAKRRACGIKARVSK